MQDALWPPAVVCEPSLKDDWVLFISLDRHSSKSFCFLNGEVLFPKSTTDASTNTSDEKLPTNVNNFVFTCGATGINFTSPSCCFGHFYCWIVQPTSTPSWRGHFTLTFGICALRCALHFSQFERYIGRHLLFHKSLVTNANFAWLPSTKQQLWRQPRPQGLLAFQNGGGSGEDPGTQQITCLQRGWRCIQNGGYGEKGEKNWVRDAKVKINKMAEKAEVQFKKK